MKYLELKVVKMNKKYSAICVRKQTHIEGDFGFEDGWQFEATNGLILSSVSMPEWNKADKAFYVRGDAPEKDNTVIVVKNKHANKIVKAVEEYNEYLKE